MAGIALMCSECEEWVWRPVGSNTAKKFNTCSCGQLRHGERWHRQRNLCSILERVHREVY